MEEIEKEEIKEEFEVPDSVQEIFDDRKNKKVTNIFRQTKSNTIRLGLFIATIILLALYYAMPVSRVKGINITGNVYLPDSYVTEASGVTKDDIFYFKIPILIEQKVNSNPFIKDSTVTLETGNVIQIDIEEKKIVGYRYDEEPILLMSDNTQAPMESKFLDIISRVPLIDGFESEDQTRMLSTAFKEVDRSIIEDMSEINQYDLGYDSQGICILMRNGGYFIANYRSLPMVNKYYEIYNYLKDKNQCIYADDSQDTAYAKACPWNEKPTEHEYWLDEEGNPLTNAYGDKAVIHYYTLKNGKYAYDNNGEKIPIPLNRQGFEEVDEDFDEHYEAGYYANGVLEMP